MLFLKGLLLIPGAKVGVASLALAAVLAGVYQVKLARANGRTDAALERAETAEHRAEVLTQQHATLVVEKDAAGLRCAIRQQSADVQRYADQAKAAGRLAAIAAIRTLQEGLAKTEALRDEPPGPERMNRRVPDILGGQ